MEFKKEYFIGITLMSGLEPSRILKFDKKHVVIGRSASNDVAAPDNRVSSCHGQIVERQGAYFYQDLRSTNGSLVERGGERYVVDGRKIAECEISDGDKILLGDAENPFVLVFNLIEKPNQGGAPASSDKGKTIVAEQAMLQFETMLPQRLADAEKLKLLFAFARVVETAEDAETLYAELLEAAKRAFPSAAFIACAQIGGMREETKIVCGHSHSNEFSCGVGPLEPFLAETAKRGSGILFDPSFSQIPVAKVLKSVVCAPIFSEDRAVGALVSIAGAYSSAFNEDDLELCALLCSLAGSRLLRIKRLDEIKLDRRRLDAENKSLRRLAPASASRYEMLGESQQIEEVKRKVSQAAKAPIPVLILGETGSGKELVARALHAQSKRANGPFAAVNCAAIPENLLESELFGHCKGAFTGAAETKKGLFEDASGGTLFLDEIGEMPLNLQVKLLRALETQEINPLGSVKPVKIDVRLVAATNRNLEDRAKSGAFRGDLYYRIAGFPIEVPPLRSRGADVLLLARNFIDEFAGQMGLDRKIELDDSSEKLLLAYSWPGNIRQLRNEMQRALLVCDEGNLIKPHHLSPAVSRQSNVIATANPEEAAAEGKTLKEMMDAFEAKLIVATLDDCGWNKSEAARRLDISRQAFLIKLAKLGITK